MVTVFKNFSDTTNPKHVPLEDVYSAIHKPSESLVLIVEEIRKEQDRNKRNILKKKLPCILFSGQFSQRGDKFMDLHSGYAVIDLDHVDDISVLKNKLKLIPYVSSAFVSPSGDGLKVVVAIESSIENHRDNYKAVLEDFSNRIEIPSSQLDKTSINESRICYASFDPDIYVNKNVKKFSSPKKIVVKYTDYNKINVAANMIRLAAEGTRHATVLRAAKLIGGYISSGVVEESIAKDIITREVEAKFMGEKDIKLELRAVEDGIAYGKSMPIYETEEIEWSANVDLIKTQHANVRRKYDFLSDPIDDRHDLDRYRNGGFKMGEPTGHKTLDQHFRFKEGEFSVVLGHANVGKSFFMWWLMVVSAVNIDWNWIVYSTENKVRQIKKKLIEFYTQTQIQDMDSETYEDALMWLDEHFTFIRIDRMYSATDLISFASVLLKEKEYKGFLIDPYNSLGIDKEMWSEFKGNRHEYDYAVGSMLVSFCDKNNISVFLNAHAMSEALRRKHPKARQGEMPSTYEGHPMPPEAADIEGGGKFVNKVTGFFMVIHRYLYHEGDRYITKVEIKKTKDNESGGMNTMYEQPVNFNLWNMCEFREYGTSTKAIEYKKPQKQLPQQQNFWDAPIEEPF